MALTSLTNLQPLHVHSVGISTFDGSVSVGGTLTYEDVTNVDAIGIITARSGVNVSGGQLDVGSSIKLGNAGVVTATTFVGALTGNIAGNATGLSGTPNISVGTISGSTGTFSGDVSIADKIIHTGDTNTAIRFPADDTFTVETNNTERFRIGSNGYIGVGNFSSKSRTDPLNVDSGIGTCNIGGNYIHLSRYSGGGTNYITAPQNNANLHISADDFISIGVDHSSSIYTHDTEAIRIISNGAVGINTDVSGNGGGAKLVVGGRIQSNAGGYWFTGANGAEDGWHVQDSGGNLTVVESGVAERLRIDSSGRVLIGTTTAGTGSGDDLTISNSSNMGLTLRSTSSNYCNIYFSDATSGTATYEGYISYNHATDSLEFATVHTERLRIDSSGHLHTGYTSNFGGDHVNILATDGGGISIAQNNSGNATSGTVLGTLSFQGYHSGGATFSSAEAKISGVAAANHTGSSAATDMVFYTKPSTTGPGSAPTERFRITANGNLNWRNGTVRQRKHGAFLGINNAGTSDIKISGNFEANDMIRVRWAYNWNAGDGGAWGEAVIWKQYESTKRVRYLTDVKANPVTSVSFPHSGNDIWLRWQTNAGINGYYMIDVECHGCDPFPF